MAQEVQIVPKFLHSHVETYINDYTEFQDEVSTPVDENSKFVAIFRSGKGIDNTFVKKTDLTDFKKTYGESNYNKYGQPLMMPIALLNSGNASVYCMRIMPDDAFAANCILSVLYKTDESTGKMTLKYRASFIDKEEFSDPSMYKTGKQFKKQIYNYAQAMRDDDGDSEGFKCMPILTFRMCGRGVYGNNFRWRIARNVDYENDYGIKMFSFEVLSVENGFEKVATYVGAMNSSSKYKNLTLINDILDDKEVGSLVMDVQVLEDEYNDLYEIYKNFVESLPEDTQDSFIPDVDEWDPFFARGIANDVTYKNLEIVPEAEDTDDITPDRPTGVPMEGGDDGAFADGIDEQELYRNEVEVYKKAFSGDLDRTILSNRRLPVDVMLDANYPFEVKQVIADLTNARESGLFYMDAGTETTIAQIDNIIDEYSIFDTRNISKHFQWYYVKDPTTKKRCPVTITYFFAQTLPSHYNTYGIHVPFVKGYSRLTGHVKNSLEPVIDDIDMDIKEKLYINRINYYETIAENNYQRCSQNTAQMINSDLMEENNMMSLFALKKGLEMDCFNELYTFTSAESRAQFSELEMIKYADWIGTRFDTLDITFDVNEWEGERSVVHCYVAVQFRNLNKRTIIEIDVNKRNFTA